MSLVFLSSGILSTVQDLGRTGFRRFGINPNGAMDRTAARLINLLLGNDENEAVLEMHFPAPKILFEGNAVFALGGANFGAEVNGSEIENWRPVFAPKNSVLSFPKKNRGNRIYLAVKDGFQIDKWLASGSTNFRAQIGGFNGKPLQKGDKLFFNRSFTDEITPANIKISKTLIPYYSAFPTVRVVAGEEFQHLTGASQKIFQEQTFKIRNESDRMGFRLQGENLNLKEKFELVSSAVSFGTIQLLPDGQLILLMADHQTTGGYPRIAHIISGDLPLAGQLGAGDKIHFQMISVEEAESLIMDFEKNLNLLKVACRF